MADFIAVIRRAVDGLSNNTPEMRTRVYDKARSAVVRQLENMSPRPPEHMLQRQLEKLDAAIREVEAEHAEALPAIDTPVFVAPEPEPEPAWAQPQAAEAPAADLPPVVETAPEPVYVAPAADVYPDDTPAEVVQQEPAQPSAPVVTGDDWADAHMSDPQSADEPETAAFDALPAVEAPVEAVDAVDALPEQAAPAWSDPNYRLSGDETDYAGMYDSRVFGEAEHRPAADGEVVRAEPVFVEAVEPAVEVAPPVSAEPVADLWPEAPEPVAAPEAVEPVWAETRYDERVAETADQLIEPADYGVSPVEPKAVMPDAVDDWLQSRASDPAPSIPVASFELPLTANPAANRIPELPDIDPTPVAVSYTPPDEFPAYAEPVRVDVDREFPVPEGLRLVASQPEPFAGVTAAPAQAADVAPDDFSQWFQDNVDAPADAANSATSQMPATPDWDAHLSTFSPDAKGATIDQTDGASRLGAGYEQPAYRLEPKKRRNFTPIILGVVGVLVIGGVGFAGWTFRDDIGSMVADLAGSPETASTPPETAPATTDVPASETAAATPAATATTDAATAPAEDGATSGQKFTQRLRTDGTEIDEGAGAAPAVAQQEGRSVSAQTVASTIEPTDAPPAATTPAGQTTTTAAPAGGSAATTAPIAGGEKLFLYEERIGQATPVAVPGSIAWSAVRETGADGKPDPQIQGRINVPERGITALVTIKRNTDNSLPASHIVEVVFSVPADFEGGAIDNLQRIAMKRTEQDRGDPLVAVTAKVTDDTYLVALNDFEDVVTRNMELLSTRGWIDIPVTYRNGRRALLTFDKGTQGANVFQQVMREWSALAPAAPAN